MFELQMSVLQHCLYEEENTWVECPPVRRLEIVFRDLTRECGDFVIDTSDTTLADLFPVGSKVNVTLTPAKK